MKTETPYAISLVLHANLPFVKKFTAPIRRLPVSDESNSDPQQEVPSDEMKNLPESVEESWFFEALSETYLPLLEMFSRLDGEHIPFRIGLSLSPVFAQMLGDDLLLKKYSAYLDQQIDFGMKEMERVKDIPKMYRLAKHYFDRTVENKAVFTTRYEENILKAFEYYRRKSNIEFLATTATQAFIPFLCPYPEAVQAQIEVALSYYRYSMGIFPQGFWLPELGWAKELESYLRAYGFGYTITDSHGFLFGSPPPSKGTFSPIKTPQGLYVLGRDFNASAGISALHKNDVYRDNNRDIGYELPVETLGSFLSKNGARYGTGYKYWKNGNGSNDELYDPAAAHDAAREHARSFLDDSCNRFSTAAHYLKEQPVSLCAFNADSFGRLWHEGPYFLESLFRYAAGNPDIQFVTPSEYLNNQPCSSYEVSLPEFSSWGDNGYAETWLDSSNDWIYRHTNRSIERMVELADRFSENSSLKERALNQAAREILLAQSSEWAAMLYRQESTGFARFQIENSLKNFTAIYEALGSSHISAEWLTSLERQHNIFPNINYRVFRRKR